MRIIALLLFFLTIAEIAQAQSRHFLAQAKNVIESLDKESVIESSELNVEEYDFLSRGFEDLEGLFLSELSDLAKNRPDQLKQSETLNALAQLSTKTWKGSHYENGKKWQKLTRYIKRAARRSTSHFNIIRSTSFRIKLVDNHGRKFYHDRKGPEGELNLYLGKRPGVMENEDEIVKELVTFHSTEVLVKQFLKGLRKKAIFNELRKGRYSFVGLSVEVDVKTLNRKKLPTARVVVLFGARRMQQFKEEEND